MPPIDRFASSPLSGWWTGYDRPPKRFAAGVGVAISLGMASGILATWFSPPFVLAALVALAFGILALKRSEFALLGILIATSSVIYENWLPMISTPYGSLQIPDVLLLASLGIIIVRVLLERDFKIERTPLDWPLVMFYGVTLVLTLVAGFGSSVDLEPIRRAIRVFTHYFTFFVVTNLVREERQLRVLVKGMFLLGTIVAAGMLIQFGVGESLQIMPGRVRLLVTGDRTYGGINRSYPPGHSLMIVSLVTVTVMLCLTEPRRLRIWKLVQWTLLGTGVLLTFLRSYWAATGMVVSFMLFLGGRQERRRLIGLGLVALLLLAGISVCNLVKPDSKLASLAAASVARGATLTTSQTIDEDSLEWRYIENEYAVRQIMSHPWIGLGPGARYRPVDPRLDRGADFTKIDPRRFIHNGHLAVMLGTGLLGYFCLAWLSAAFLIRGFRYWRIISDPQMRGLVLGFTLAFLGVLIAAVVNSTFMKWSWTPVIGIMMGINEVILRKVGQEASVA